ncbi:hypothetical protein GCM10023074_60930 [Microbispora amethystogenes]|uniref:Uncharacterized protein n=1 Tax=Microbispora amethystogenes TaxID=1427754 RepID=A0ABQ4FJR1_9ACTN|nr:hypothetical protein Mam01_52020 [Microbispora amethystogenes]
MFEATFTITPEPCARITAISCFMARKTPVVLTWRARAQSSSGRSATAPPTKIPALLTATSRRPNRVTICRTSRATSGESVTSAVTAAARPPSASMSLTVCSSASRPREAATTTAPSRANPRATARPAPEPAPVTSTTLSANLIRTPCRVDAAATVAAAIQLERMVKNYGA